jgi:hypothetical protein
MLYKSMKELAEWLAWSLPRLRCTSPCPSEETQWLITLPLILHP